MYVFGVISYLPNAGIEVVSIFFFLRVLGKFGGGNRKMMAEPQKLEYVKRDFPNPSIMISFPEHTKTVQLPIDKVMTIDKLLIN